MISLSRFSRPSSAGRMAAHRYDRGGGGGGRPRHPRWTEEPRRGGRGGELLLAVPPTLVAMGTLLAVGAVAGPPVLVVPVVTSAFLLYRVPTDPMNDLGVLAPAHVTGLALGVGAALLVQPGALAAALALGATLLLLGVADHRHPAAPVTALVFASVARPEQGSLDRSGKIVR